MTLLNISPETALQCGPLSVTLAPAAGGRITRLASEGPNGTIDWLVPLADEVRQAGFAPTAWPKAGCYPLVPFSNRIAQGRFGSAGRTAALPLHPGEAHALHGGSHRMPWTLIRHDAGHATMAYRHRRGDQGWPWSFDVTQDVLLDHDRLTLTLQVTNTDDAEMPCGLGFHPYFPAAFADRIGFTASALWPPDDSFLGTPPRPVPVADDYAVPRPLADLELTQYYGQWDGQATLAARDGRAIRMQADAALRHMVLHRPAGRGYFCVEPVSHVSNAAHLQASVPGTGWLALAPRASAEARMALHLAL
jgi:aldose 1-epimerase